MNERLPKKEKKIRNKMSKKCKQNVNNKMKKKEEINNS
jgi:hypothetical protein